MNMLSSLVLWYHIIHKILRYLVVYGTRDGKGTAFRRYANLVGFLLRIYVTLTLLYAYHDSEAEDTKSLKFKWRDPGSNPRPLAPSTTPPPLPDVTVSASREKFNIEIFFLVQQN